MLDKVGRIAIGQELLSRANLRIKQEVGIYFDHIQKRMLLLPQGENPYEETLYYVRTNTIDEKGRIYIPKSIRDAFKEVTYLPSEKNGDIYILIIQNEKKPE